MLQSCKHQRNIQYFFCIVRNVDITNVLEILWYNFEAESYPDSASSTEGMSVWLRRPSDVFLNCSGVSRAELLQGQPKILFHGLAGLLPQLRVCLNCCQSHTLLAVPLHDSCLWSPAGEPSINHWPATRFVWVSPALVNAFWTRCLLGTNCDLSREHNRT